MKKIIILTLISFYMKINAQNKKIIWDDQERTPIEYATVKSSDNYAISNENGEFSMENLKGILNIQRLGYQNIEISSEYFIKNDTIKMMPYVYQLEEIVVTKDDKFKKMVSTILTDYALEPHQENFFLRVILKKNDEYYKIIDFSGNLERKTLFDVSSKPMPKNNYAVSIKNMRKVGFENRDLDFEMLSFENFFTRIATIYLSPKIYNFKNNVSQDNSYTKLEVTPKDLNETKTTGYYLINNIDNSFNEVFISNKDNNIEFSKKGSLRYRTTNYELKTNFKRNEISNKYQLNMAVFKNNVETVLDNDKNNFEITYIYYSTPLNSNSNIKNNINLNNDMFDLNIKYNPEYWKNHEILPLTNEMQEFINKVNSTGKNSDFRTKSNIK
jgi:hypothetical protein